MPAAEGGGRWPGPIIERDGERCYRGPRGFRNTVAGVEAETVVGPLFYLQRLAQKSGTDVEIASLQVSTREGGGWFARFLVKSWAFAAGRKGPSFRIPISWPALGLRSGGRVLI
jgi:hypothetical protein